jgi:hypothetical protein
MLVFQLKVTSNACMKKFNVEMLAESASAKFFIKNALASLKPVFQSLDKLYALNKELNVQATAWNALHLIKNALITV